MRADCKPHAQDPSAFLFLFDTPSSADLIVSPAKIVAAPIYIKSGQNYVVNYTNPYHIGHNTEAAFYFENGPKFVRGPTAIVFHSSTGSTSTPSDGLILPRLDTNQNGSPIEGSYSDDVLRGLAARGVQTSSRSTHSGNPVFEHSNTHIVDEKDADASYYLVTTRILYRWEYQVLRLE